MKIKQEYSVQLGAALETAIMAFKKAAAICVDEKQIEIKAGEELDINRFNLFAVANLASLIYTFINGTMVRIDEEDGEIMKLSEAVLKGIEIAGEPVMHAMLNDENHTMIELNNKDIKEVFELLDVALQKMG